MCGRYATSATEVGLTQLFDAVPAAGLQLTPDYNVAPTDAAPIVRVSKSAGGRVLSQARWGFVPSWAPDARGAARMINARVETVASSRVFAGAFASRRCLVPVDGWYEWLRPGRASARRDSPGAGAGARTGARGATRGGSKQAYFVTRPDGGTLALAGLWGLWRRGEQTRLGFTIVTTEACGRLALVHDRAPLALPPTRWAWWLDGPDSQDVDGTTKGFDSASLVSLSAQTTAELEIRAVGPAVGDVRNGGPELTVGVPAPSLGTEPQDLVDLSLF